MKAVRHSGPFEKSPLAAYAARLHKTLQDACVAHKVVTVKFRYQSRILLNREGEDTAAIARAPVRATSGQGGRTEEAVHPARRGCGLTCARPGQLSASG